MRGLILCHQPPDITPTINKGKPVWPPLSWVQSAVDKLAGLGIPVSVAASEEQFDDYTPAFTHQLQVNTNDPLQHLFAFHTLHPKEDLFVLASDLLELPAYLLEQLLSDYHKQTAGVYLYSHGFEYEPLCGIYTAKAIPQMMRLHKKGHLLPHILKQVNTFAVPIAGDQKKYFNHFTGGDTQP